MFSAAMLLNHSREIQYPFLESLGEGKVNNLSKRVCCTSTEQTKSSHLKRIFCTQTNHKQRILVLFFVFFIMKIIV